MQQARILKSFCMLCMAAVFLFGHGVLAETITLKNGGVVRGKIVGQSRTSVRIQTNSGVRTINKSDIRRISYESAADLERQRQAEQRKREEDERRKRAEEEERRKQADAEANASNETDTATGEIAAPLSYSGFLLRNAALPGWGFFANDQPGWGSVYAIATGAAVIYAYTTRQAAIAAQDENYRQVELNTLISLAPGSFDSSTRLAFGLLTNTLYSNMLPSGIGSAHSKRMA